MPFAILATVYLVRQLLKTWSPAQRIGLAALGGLVMGVLFILMVQTKGPLGDTINNRLNGFVWRSNAQLSDYADRFASGRLLVSGANRHAMVTLARYQRPVKVKQYEGGALGAAKLKADARCVSHLRRYPLVLNYKNCKGFKPHKPRPMTYREDFEHHPFGFRPAGTRIIPRRIRA